MHVELNAASLELYAWATVRTFAEHQKAFGTIEEKLQHAHEINEKQGMKSFKLELVYCPKIHLLLTTKLLMANASSEIIRQQLLRFASMIKEAFSMLLMTRPAIPNLSSNPVPADQSSNPTTHASPKVPTPNSSPVMD
jgi:hypothetical protein